MTDKGIQKGLEQDARWDSERIPKMSRQNILQKVQALRNFMQRQKLGQADVARMLGVSPSVISQYLGNTYKGDLDNLTVKIIDLINTVDRRSRQFHKRPFIETSIAKRINTIIKQTRAFSNEDEGAISVIIGDSGHGKSICLREYKAANKNAIYVGLDDTMGSTRIFSEIAKEIGVDYGGSLDNIARRIVTHLQNRETVVLIDEAASLTVKQLSQLRTVIVDQCRCPLILAGNCDLLKTIMQPHTRRGFESLDQFRSRLLCILNLDEVAAHGSKDGGGVYTAEDVRKLFEFGGIRLTTDATAVLRKISKTSQSGRLRTCMRIITAIHVANAAKKGEIDGQLIMDAVAELGLPVRANLPLSIKDEPAEEQKQAIAKAAG